MQAQTVAVTDREFPSAVIGSDLPVLVDFWAPWCGPCRLVAPILEELAAEYAGRLKVAKVNVEEDREQAARYGVQSIPTMILFQNGVEADRLVGALPKPLLELWIAQAAGGGSPGRGV